MSLVRSWIGSIPMEFKPNYRFGRAERDQLKQAKKDEKLKRQHERASLRRDSGSTETRLGRAAVAPQGGTFVLALQFLVLFCLLQLVSLRPSEAVIRLELHRYTPDP